MKKDTNGENQRWKIEAVEQDFDGFDLYYKIVSNADSNVGLTSIPTATLFLLTNMQAVNFRNFVLILTDWKALRLQVL